MKFALVLLAVIVGFSTPAEARHRHHHYRVATSYAAHPDCNVLWPCIGVAPSARGLRVVQAMGGFGSARQVYTPARKAARRARTAHRRVSARTPARPPVAAPARSPGLPAGFHPEFLAEVPPRGMTRAAVLASLETVFSGIGLVPTILANGRAVVRASTGAVAYVAASAAHAFQCVVNQLEAGGYRIKEMGGWADHGHIRHSFHYRGMAIDINQLYRNVTSPPMPKNEIAIANGCGLISGAQWANGDSGHFQFGGYDGRTRYASARRHHRHVRYARHYHHRKIRLATR